MSNPEKDDEGLARKWLESQGYTDITRPCSDPPDYVVNSAYAVEVRRLNQRIEVDGRTEGEENSRKSLHRTIGRTLVEIDPPANDQNWVVDCKYDFSRPLPRVQVVKEQICEALRPLTQPYNTDVINQLRSKHLNHDKHRDELDLLSYLHLCLLCGICLELEPFDAHKPAKFLLPDVSGWEGIFVAHELINSIQHSVAEKSLKVRKTNRINDYEDWWLVLIDHICHAPISILRESELKTLWASIQDRGCWSRIVIISSKNVNWFYEL